MAAAARGKLTAGNAETGLAVADVLAMRWFLDERWLVYFMKTDVVHQSAGSL